MRPIVAVVPYRPVLPYALPSLATLVLAGMLVPGPVDADIRITDDYIAIVAEAEDSDTRDERWVLTLPDTPAIEDDPDGNHSDQAVGSAYLELLPDTRVSHGDELIHNENYWGATGVGPRGEWSLAFPEGGRYHVHFRALSTGTEDNGIHVGLNGDWPLTGKALQHCSAGAGWWWSSRQRDSGGTACGVEKTIWVDVPSAGTHTFMVSAREDGYELDRFMLIKDVSGNTRICKPSGADDIDCRNGAIESPDELVDLTVRLEGPEGEITVGDTIGVTALASNQDLFDTAADATLEVDLALDDEWEIVASNEACAPVANGLSCDLGDIEASEAQEIGFELTALRAGSLEVIGRVGSASEEELPDNDTARLDVDASEAVVPALLEISTAGVETLTVGETGSWSVRIENRGQGTASDGSLTLSVPASLAVQSLPAACGDTGSGAVCEIDDLEPGAVRSLDIGLRAVAPGSVTVGASMRAANVLENDMSSSRGIQVIAPQTDTGGSTDGEEPDGSDDGQDGGGTGSDTGGETAVEPSGKSSGGGSGGAGGLLLLAVCLAAAWRRRSVSIG